MTVYEFLEEKKLYECLNYFDSYFTPTLTERVKDLKTYTNKISKYAKNYYISTEKGEIAGFVSFYCNDYKNKTAYLTLIAKNKKFKHKGIGKKLLNVCIEKCKENNMTILELEVQKNNSIAMNFYIKNGFYTFRENDLSFFMKKEI